MSAPRGICVVTGVARAHGIGRAIVRAFLGEGYLVGGLDLAPLDTQQHPDDALAQHKDRFHFVQADVGDFQQVQAAVNEVVERFQPHKVCAVINNAGIANPYVPDGANPVDAWEKMIRTNLTGPFLVTHACLPHLQSSPLPSIVHISSTRARMSEPNTEGYGAAKAGLCGLTHAQAQSLAGRARVNAVLPGWVSVGTDGWDEIGQEDMDWHAAGRVGVPEDIAHMCLFLSDPNKAGFITAQEFVVDGGVTKKMVYPK